MTLKSVVQNAAKVHPVLLEISAVSPEKADREEQRSDRSSSIDSFYDATQDNTEGVEISSSSRKSSRKSTKFGQQQNDVREKIVKEVLDQIMPDLGAYAIDGTISKPVAQKSAVFKWLQFFGCLTLDLHDAILTGYVSQVKYSIAKITIGKNAQPERINEYDSEGRTALSLAAKIDNLEMVQELLDANALCDIVDEGTGRTPLYYSVQNRNQAMTKMFLNRGASANTADFQCVTPLMIACTTNDHRHVQMLCDGHADVDLQDERGWTALHYATVNNAEKCVALLLREGADRDLRDINRRKPIHFAKYKDYGNCIAILSSKAQIGL